MKLGDLTSLIHAGGPGSGRHPGEVHTALHQALLKHGYSLEKHSERRATYAHPSGQHNAAQIYQSGQWQVGDSTGSKLSSLRTELVGRNISR